MRGDDPKVSVQAANALQDRGSAVDEFTRRVAETASKAAEGSALRRAITSLLARSVPFSYSIVAVSDFQQ